MSAVRVHKADVRNPVELEMARLRELNADLERRLSARASEIDFANHELEVFAEGITHDLRAPLRAIEGFSKALREKQGPYLDADAKHYLERIDANAMFMGRLIEALLKFSHVTRADLNLEQVDPTALARAALGRLRQRAVESGVEVDICQLPACRADPILLQQAFASLLDNGIKFTRGRPHGRVTIG